MKPNTLHLHYNPKGVKITEIKSWCGGWTRRGVFRSFKHVLNHQRLLESFRNVKSIDRAKDIAKGRPAVTKAIYKDSAGVEHILVQP